MCVVLFIVFKCHHMTMTTNDYDFVEIGTSDFDTLIQQVTDTDNRKGISVEPIRRYLQSLPYNPNVRKVHAAIVTKTSQKTVRMYGLPESAFVEHRLPGWLRGCNSVNAHHPMHIALKLSHLVVKEDVPAMTIVDLWNRFQIGKVGYLKIDTEGCDCGILTQLYQHLCQREKHFEQPWPHKIQFEQNMTVADPKEVQAVLKLYGARGYRRSSPDRDKDNVTLVLM